MLTNEPLFTIADGIQTKWASPENPCAEKGKGGQLAKGRKGRPSVPLAPGETLVLAEEQEGSGTIRRIWSTISERAPEVLRGLVFECYWDGASEPAISVPFGDFFGMGLGRMAAFESALFHSPEGRSFNCFIPMPFRNGMKIMLKNNSSCNIPMVFYDVDYTMGDEHGSDALYLHARFNHQKETVQREDFEILPKVQGRGRFLGANIGVIADCGKYFSSWWGEGEVKVYLDGDDKFPTLCGTGTEDYIGTGWGQGGYNGLYTGCTVADFEKMQYCFYRYHILDPIYFYQEIRVTIQQIGCWNPDVKPLFAKSGITYESGDGEILDFSTDGVKDDYGLFERQDDWSCCAYFYLDRP